jgi:hypothetical protein
MKAGVSIGIIDMIIPKEKQIELDSAYKQIAVVEKQYRQGIITDGERYNKIIDVWTHAGEEISNVMFRTLEHNEGRKELNPVFLMVDSGARGNRQQVKQLAGMRGLMAKPSGEIIERPITSNFREGLTVLEYFISTHGARKGLADTALKTADSGYLTRKLVDASQDVIIFEDDCGTTQGIVVRPIYEGDEEVVDLATRLIGRVSCETVKDPVAGTSVLKKNHLIDERPRSRSRRSASSISRFVPCLPAKPSVAAARSATAATWPPARWSSSAKRSASSPHNPSANPARSSPCVPSTSAASHPARSSSRSSRRRTMATCASTTSASCRASKATGSR